MAWSGSHGLLNSSGPDRFRLPPGHGPGRDSRGFFPGPGGRAPQAEGFHDHQSRKESPAGAVLESRLEHWLQGYGLDIPLPTYFFMLVVSITLASLVLILYQHKYRLHERAIYSFLCWAIPSLFIGAKIVFWLQFPEIAKRGRGFWLGGGAALYGGLLRILVAGALTSLYYCVPIRRYLDGLALALSLGLVTGRIGCFLAGCNYGQVTQQPWGVCFPMGSPAYSQQLKAGLLESITTLSLPVHPTQLYESAIVGAMFSLGL